MSSTCPSLPVIPVTDSSNFDMSEIENELQSCIEISRLHALFDKIPFICRNTANFSRFLRFVILLESPSIIIANEILAICPLSARVVDNDGNLPIHLAVMIGKLPLVENLLVIYSEGCIMVNFFGMNPLHLALKCDNPSIGIVRAIVSTCPAAARVTSTKGRLPIHMLLDYNSVTPPHPGIVRLVAQAYVPGLVQNVTDIVTKFDLLGGRTVVLQLTWNPLSRAVDKGFDQVLRVMHNEVAGLGLRWVRSQQLGRRHMERVCDVTCPQPEGGQSPRSPPDSG